MSTFGTAIFDLAKDDKHLEELRRKLNSQTPRLGLKRNYDGETILHRACQHGAKKIAKELVQFCKQDMPSILASRTKKGYSPLHLVAEYSDKDMMEEMLEGLSITNRLEALCTKDTMGRTPLYLAAVKDKTDMVEYMLRSVTPKAFDLLSEKDSSGKTVLHDIAGKGKSTLLDLMLATVSMQRFDLVMNKDIHGQNLLLLAVLGGKPEDVVVLLKDLSDQQILQLFTVACENPFHIATEQILGRSPLHMATEKNNSAVLNTLLETLKLFKASDQMGVLQTKDAKGSTCLHVAVKHRSHAALSTLLKFIQPGEKMKLLCEKDRSGNTALHAAVSKKDAKSVGIIMISVQATDTQQLISQTNSKQQSVLRYAVIEPRQPAFDIEYALDFERAVMGEADENPENKIDLVKSLINTLDVSTKVELLKCKCLEGRNVVHAAASNCSLAILQHVVKGVSAETLLDLLAEKDKDGYTALSSACVNSNKENFQYLLHILRSNESTRLVLAQDLRGNTVLHLVLKPYDKLILPRGLLWKPPKVDFSNTTDFVQSIVFYISQDVLSNLLKVKNIEGETPLHLAMKSERVDAATMILESIPQDVLLYLAKEQDFSGKTLLHNAFGSPDMMRILLEYIGTSKYDILSRTNEDHKSYLHLSAQEKDSDTAMLMLNSLTSVAEKQLKIMGLKDHNGQTFLHLASSKNQELMKTLVQSETYSKLIVHLLCIRDDQGRTVTDTAEDEELKQQLKELPNEPVFHLPTDPRQLLAEDPVNSHPPDILQKLMNSKHPETKQTILHAAILSGRTDVIKHLKEQLNDKHLWKTCLLEKDWLDQNCIHAAVQKGEMECLNILIDNELKSSPDLCLQLYVCVNGWLENCAHIAVRLRSTDVLEWMLQGLSSEHLSSLLKQKDFRGQTVLHAAAKLGIQRVNILLTQASSKLKIATQKELMVSTDNQECTAADVAVHHPKLQKYLISFTEYYYLPQLPRCLVIFMTGERPGADSEADSLVEGLQEAGVDPKPHKDISKNEMMRVIKEAAEQDSVSGLVVVIMAHGDRAVIYDSAAKEVKIQAIIDCMNDDKLVGKPKLLVIQACQGKKKPGAGLNSDALPGIASQQPPSTAEVAVESSETLTFSSPLGAEASTTALGLPSLPNYEIKDRDIMVLCSTLPGFVSQRNYFIRKFARHLGKSSDSEGVYAIYEKTLQEMSDDEEGQTAYVKSSLKYPFALKRVWTEG